jgi:hypothetical protein
VRRLGLVDYATALDLQKQLVEERRSGAIGDTLLLEHPPVITVGAPNRVGRSNVIASEDELVQAGFTVHDARDSLGGVLGRAARPRRKSRRHRRPYQPLGDVARLRTEGRDQPGSLPDHRALRHF